MENVRCGRHLFVEGRVGYPQVDLEGVYRVPLAGTHIHKNISICEPEPGTVEPEVLFWDHGLQEAWNGNVGLIEEHELELLEQRGGHSRENCFQVGANPSEPQPAKVRKFEVGDERPTKQLRIHIALGKNGGKADPESLELGQKGKLLKKVLWTAVSRWMDVLDRKCDKADNGREPWRSYWKGKGE